jgi:hypothetical protein
MPHYESPMAQQRRRQQRQQTKSALVVDRLVLERELALLQLHLELVEA